jgi:serine/threonine protein kinase
MAILSNYSIIQEFGYGMFATVYKIQTPNKKKYALKIQHIKKSDIKPNPKSSIWEEINFSINFANKYPTQFVKLYEYDFINGCKYKQKYSFDISQFPPSLQKKFAQLSSSSYCVRIVYDLIDGNLYELEGKLTVKQIYSMIIQLTYTIQLLHSANYVHGDIHNRNIGWIKTGKTTKIKLGKLNIPTYGYIFKLIDYGMVSNGLNKMTKKEKVEFVNNFENELVLLVHFMVDSAIYDYNNENKINMDFNADYAKFKKTRYYNLIYKYSTNKYIQMFLFDILFPDQYQSITFGEYYVKTIPRKLFIPFEDIEYFILNYKTPNLIIKYFNNKLS